jgi:predicted RNase H-like HicB family nuclease
MKLSVLLQTRDDGVRAFCPDLPGCSANGRTDAEALARLRVRIASCFTIAPVTPPNTRVVRIEV